MDTEVNDDFYGPVTGTYSQAQEDAVSESLFSPATTIRRVTETIIDSNLPVTPMKKTRRAKVSNTKKSTTKSKKTAPKEEPIKVERTENTKLRLLVIAKCHNDCPLCCNKQFNLNSLPVVDRWDYDEVCITGGEPLSTTRVAHKVIDLIEGIRAIWNAQGRSGKIYVYTSTRRVDLLRKAAIHADGIVYTIHGMHEGNVLSHFIYQSSRLICASGKSFRLNYFKGDEKYLPSSDTLRRHLYAFWKVKVLEWIPDCPVPQGEDFRKIKSLL